MMWSKITRKQYERAGLWYSSDLTEAEWALIAPYLPEARRVGRPRTDLRRIVNAILYLARAGCPWRMLPRDFPPRSTVQDHFYAWRREGLWQKLNFLLLMQARETLGREASPTAGVIDSQSVKTTEAGGLRGFDAGKKIMGRKRHILTDTNGWLVAGQVHSAAIQDRDGAVPLLASIRRLCPWLRHIFADGGYAGDKLASAMANHGDWTIEIVKRSDPGFVVLPRRWVVERTFAWLNRDRRLAKDFEARTDTAEAWLFIASVRLFVRRLAMA